MTNRKRALITGITGQDGSYLAEFLLSKGYEVHGIVRRSSTFNTERVEHIYQDIHEKDLRFEMHYGDLSDAEQTSNIIYNLKPQEIYNLGAQSHVRVSFDMPEYTSNITALGCTRILEAIRRSGLKVRFYQASSSEIFGATLPPQNEKSPFKPRSPYACAKAYAYWMTVNYREGYNLFACNGVLFNHESPRRGQTFVSRKITRAVADILAKKQKCLYLGDLTPKRDWGFAPEYVEMMWKMLNSHLPEDFVLGTGNSHSVREFVKLAFSYVGLNWEEYTKIDRRYFRPTEVGELCADASLARKKLNWHHRINFQDLVKIMVDADMRKAGLVPVGEGDEIIRKKFPDRWWKAD
ncbi:MAG: GDP-mannose 4,6-dehydratase [Candidatus Omnitrophota bacterium]